MLRTRGEGKGREGKGKPEEAQRWCRFSFCYQSLAPCRASQQPLFPLLETANVENKPTSIVQTANVEINKPTLNRSDHASIEDWAIYIELIRLFNGLN